MNVHQPIDRVRNWHAWLAAWRLIQVGFVVWVGLLIGAVAAWRLLGTAAPQWSVAAAGLLVISGIMAIIGVRERPDRTRGAWLLDDALGSQNLFGTLLSLDGDGGGVREHLATEAETAARKLHPPKHYPMRLSRIGKWSWLPVVVLVGTLFVPLQDPFGWRDTRERQVARDTMVEAATAAIDEQLAAPVLSDEAREWLESAKAELENAAGEHEAAAVLAKMQQQAGESKSAEELAMAQQILKQTASAAGPESSAAALANAGNQQNEGSTNQPGGNDPQTAGTESNPAPNPAGNDGSQSQPDGAGQGEENAGAGKPTGNDATTASADGKSASESGSSGGDGEAQAGGASSADTASAGNSGSSGNSGSQAGGGEGGNGIGLGGGSSATGSGGAVAFNELHVRGKEVDGTTIEELMRYEDDETDDGAPRRFQQATAAAAANARVGLARSRVPNAAAAAVRGYFDKIAADAAE